MTLPGLSVRRPVTMMMVFFAVIIVGAVCFIMLPIDLMPEMDIPAISVVTVYDGASPEDVEEKVTEVLERSLSIVPDLDHIVSTSREGVSVITLTFEWDTDLDTRANDVRDAVGYSQEWLPDDSENPRIFKFDVSQFPVLVYGVTAVESYSELDRILEDQLEEPLKRLPGVGSVNVRVPLVRQVNVDLDRERMAACGLSPQEVVRAITSENKDTPAGNIESGLTDYLIRVPGEFHEVGPMNQIVLAVRNGSVIRLGDVAKVSDSFKEQKYFSLINGKPGGIFFIQKQSGANTVEVARAVKKRMPELLERIPGDIEVFRIMDSSEDIELMVSDLARTLIQGGILVMAVVLLFLRRWRASLIVGITIPFSLIGSVIAMYFLDYTINMMTLFGMIVSVGLIVDNAVVVLENITRHREEGERPAEAAEYGASEVAMAITASTLTTACIFFPVLFIRGITKIFFTTFAVVMLVVVLGSLLAAVLFTPTLSAALFRREKTENQGRFFQWSERVFRKMSDLYARILDWSLGHRLRVITISVLILAGSSALLPFLGTEFLPKEDRNMIMGSARLPVGTRTDETARVMSMIQKIFEEEVDEEERTALFTRCGTTGDSYTAVMGEEGSNVIRFGIELVPVSARKRSVHEIAGHVRRRMKKEQGEMGLEKFRLELGDPMTGMLLGNEQPLTINILGDDMEATDALAARLKKIAENIPGAVDIAVSREKGRPELWLNVDRAKASNLGLNVSNVGDTVRASYYGREAGVYRIRGDEYKIFVRFREADRDETTDLLATPVKTPTGRIVRAENISELSKEYGPIEIDRKDRSRVVNVVGDVHGRSLGEVVGQIQEEIDKMYDRGEIPPDVEIRMAGQTEEQEKSFFWLILALIVGAFLVYMVMASQFESYRHPFVVMFSIPFAFSGVFVANFLGGHHVSIITFLGMLMLIGIVVNNAIVLVDYINILRARGLDMIRAVTTAGRTRLRPVLMTALTTIVALIPMAFTKGQGHEVWNPLGLTVMFGLLVSTLVTMILIPTLYTIFEGWRRADK